MAAAIRQGTLCRSCSNKQCRDIGTEQEPIEIECPACNGGGCDECDEGSFKVIDCPNKYCRDVVQVANLADLFGKGILPVAGGALDQSAWFMEAVNVLERDEQSIKAERDK